MALDRSGRDISNGTWIAEIGRGVPELRPFKVPRSLPVRRARAPGENACFLAYLRPVEPLGEQAHCGEIFNGPSSGTPRPIWAIQVLLDSSRHYLCNVMSTRPLLLSTAKI